MLEIPNVPFERLDDVKEYLKEGKAVEDPHPAFWSMFGYIVRLGTHRKGLTPPQLAPELEITCSDMDQMNQAFDRLEQLAKAMGLKPVKIPYEADGIPYKYLVLKRLG